MRWQRRSSDCARSTINETLSSPECPIFTSCSNRAVVATNGRAGFDNVADGPLHRTAPRAVRKAGAASVQYPERSAISRTRAPNRPETDGQPGRSPPQFSLKHCDGSGGSHPGCPSEAWSRAALYREIDYRTGEGEGGGPWARWRATARRFSRSRSEGGDVPLTRREPPDAHGRARGSSRPGRARWRGR